MTASGADETRPRRITLSFDNGPTPRVTESVADILAEHGVVARFFVIGQKLKLPGARDAVERVLDDGHLVGGHTWSHAAPFGLLAADDLDRELDDTRRIVDEFGGDGLCFRPYGVGGAMDHRLMSEHGATRLCQDGYTCVLWNSVPGDWLDADRWLDTALADVATRDWSVVVLHDLPIGAIDRLDDFLLRLEELGVEFTTETPDDCTPIRNGVPTSSYDLLGVRAVGT